MPKQLGNDTAYLETPIEYHAFTSAKGRCINPKNKHFALYGGRGIRFRLANVHVMIDEIGLRPSSKHSLDRIDVNGHYEVGNIKWSTKTEQARNRQDALLATVAGETKPLKEWCELIGVKYHTVYMRMKRRKISASEAISSFS